MLEDIKILLGIAADDKDELLELLISQATAEAKAFTNSDINSTLRAAIIKMVVFNYNRLGTEGLDSEGYSGVSYKYSSDYPDAIMRLLKSCKKIITL